jgi:hypothetical protein
MRAPIDSRLLAAFGSETRVRTLAVLANAFRPLTAYRIAKTGDILLSKVYGELERLAGAGVVARRGKGWVLLDWELGFLVAKRVRVSWSEDLESARSMHAREADSIHARLGSIPRAKPPAGFFPRNRSTYERPAFKDRRLRELGLPSSVHD